MKTLYITTHGVDSKDIKIAISQQKPPLIMPDECLVRVISSGINPSDALALTGYFKHAVLPRIPGRDFAGMVVQGPAQLIGKNVWGTGGDAGISSDGTQAAYIKIKLDEIAEIPDNLDVTTAGAQTLPFVTAYYSLVTRARIKTAESVLVVGALGQVGRAAMSILQWRQCQPIALVRGQVELAKAIELGWNAINSEENNLFEKILAANQGQAVAVILNSVGNQHWSTFLKLLAKHGRIVTIGARENCREAMVNLFDLYRANQELIGINTIDLNFYESAKILNSLKPGFQSGQLQPLPIDPQAIFPVEQAIHAYQQVLNGSDKRVLIRF